MRIQARSVRRLVAAGGAVAVSLVAFAACGQSEEDKISEIITSIGEDPATLCTEHGTDSLVESLGGEEECVADAEQPDQADPDVEVNSVEIDGDQATATITPQSGGGEAEPTTINFVKEGDVWKFQGGESAE